MLIDKRNPKTVIVDGWNMTVYNVSIDLVHRKLDVCRLVFNDKDINFDILREFEGSFIVEGKTDVILDDNKHEMTLSDGNYKVFSLHNVEFRLFERGKKFLKIGFHGHLFEDLK